jgi:glycosyltransferase involved in cell wall biosynthesis
MISAIVLTKNEEKNIRACLTSLLFCDEIIIIDDYSDDLTFHKIKETKLKVKIYRRHLNNDFAKQRNYGLTKTKGDWILFVDADERIPQLLRDEIQQKTKDGIYDAFYIKRRDFFLGKEMKYGETGNMKILRLALKNSGKWRRKVHETWNVKGNIGELKNHILHYPHKTISEFINDINNYSTIHSEENKIERKKPGIDKIILYPIGKFFVNYFFKLGFLDGMEGFILATMMSFHSFLAWSKLWIS